MLPKILKIDIRMRALDELTREELNELRDAIQYINIMDVDNVHESFLPWLAWWFRAEQWDDHWAIEQKRTSVKEAIVLFRFKGTSWAVERSISLSGFESEVVPWHEQVPIAENGTFSVLLPVNKIARAIDGAMQNTIANAIERNKRGSQHWDVRYEVDDESTLYIGAYKAAVYDITIGPRPPQPNVYGEALAAPYITVYEHIEIPLK